MLLLARMERLAVVISGGGQVGTVCAADGGAFRVLSAAEVEAHLTAISERD